MERERGERDRHSLCDSYNQQWTLPGVVRVARVDSHHQSLNNSAKPTL